ncbi:TonB-dependent receptor [uncultured Maribacter sp.]|uniref:TonB-dependent receptor n=1 Tax=uncultured Maribacter sp. TaxID=431308 RepID=UPI0030EC337A
MSLFLVINAIGQDYTLQGTILDTLNTPLTRANILAFPEDENGKTRFAISDDNGSYLLKLKENVNYQIEVSYLGYQKKIVEIKLDNDTKRDFILQAAVNVLDEVVINYKIPITIKEDTIIYDIDSFVNGQERKLREVLKKLPGVEVDREGNTTVKGKKVTNVMVDGKIFFTGDGKLAVNNIPADAISQIEILDNYSEVSFLKGLEDSDKMAMNIRLKEDKKKFLFGDIEAGSGIENRYLLHPTLFYYSPKTNINVIGDLNNTGKKSFTIDDYISFEGGFGTLMNDIKGYANLYTDDFSRYLANEDFKENTNRFGAFNLRKSLSEKTDINTYVIANGSKTETESIVLNQYISDSLPFSENRNNNNILENFFVIAKLTLNHKPNTNVDFSANSFIKVSKNQFDGSIFTTNPFQANTFQTNGELDATNLKQNFEYSKKFNKAQTISLETTLNYMKNSPRTNWINNAPFLTGLIPLQEDTTFKISQQIETQTTNFDFIFKDYWVLNNFNHIYTSLGINLSAEDYFSVEKQELSNEIVNNLSSEGFGNELDYRFSDIFIGLEYKFLLGNFTTKSGLFYHNYRLENEQFGIETLNNTQLLLPQISFEAELNSSERINFKYRARVNYPNSSKLIRNFLLTDFNQVFQGNPNLNTEKFHSYSLGYYKFNLFRGLNLNTNLFYNKKTQSIKNTTILQGIEQFRTLTMFKLPEHSVSGTFNFSKKIKNIKYSLKANVSYNEFFQIVNDDTSKNISKTLNSTGKIETFFKKWPNWEFGYTYSPSSFSTANASSDFSNNEFFFNMQYVFFNDFLFKADYSRVDYQNKTTQASNEFDISSVSLFYQKEDNPWGFQIEATNLFNNRLKRSNSFSDFLISDQTTFLLPRIVMLKVSYKL